MEEINFLSLMYTTLRSVVEAHKICSRISKEKQLNLIWLISVKRIIYSARISLPTMILSRKPIEEYIHGLSSSSSDQYQSSEISSVTVSSVITDDIDTAITSKYEKSDRGRIQRNVLLLTKQVRICLRSSRLQPLPQVSITEKKISFKS